MSALPALEALQPEMTAWRRDIHAHPELGFEEHRTSDLVAERLTQWGIEVHRGIGKTGLVGVLCRGDSPRTLGLRADMDALPVQELNGFEHRSTHAGRMHACGHDGHTAMLLGAARHLAQEGRFDGTVHFIFQPAEEGIGGAAAMVADGLFTRFPCEAIFGMHNRPGLPVGHFAVKPGPMMAGGAFFDIDITGNGAHAARPDMGVDSVVVAAHAVTALQSIVARNLYPFDNAVLSVTQMHAGDAYNVIPHTARLSGTVRAFSMKTIERIEAAIVRTIEGVAASHGASATLDFRLMFKPTINDVNHARFVADVCAQLVGEDRVDRDPPLIMASEDFSYMLHEVPGCYFNIGNGTGEGACEVHNPRYDFNDDALALGASAFVRIVEARLDCR